jgi:ABC-type uncharacterized transport system substrate-binding protein
VIRAWRPDALVTLFDGLVFEFWINLKTASELGITISQSVLQQATEVVQ